MQVVHGLHRAVKEPAIQRSCRQCPSVHLRHFSRRLLWAFGVGPLTNPCSWRRVRIRPWKSLATDAGLPGRWSDVKLDFVSLCVCVCVCKEEVFLKRWLRTSFPLLCDTFSVLIGDTIQAGLFPQRLALAGCTQLSRGFKRAKLPGGQALLPCLCVPNCLEALCRFYCRPLRWGRSAFFVKVHVCMSP